MGGGYLRPRAASQFSIHLLPKHHRRLIKKSFSQLFYSKKRGNLHFWKPLFGENGRKKEQPSFSKNMSGSKKGAAIFDPGPLHTYQYTCGSPDYGMFPQPLLATGSRAVCLPMGCSRGAHTIPIEPSHCWPSSRDSTATPVLR